MFLKKSLVFSLLLTSCGEPPIVDQNTDVSKKTDKLLIVNDTGQSYTLLDQLHGKTNITPNLKMSLDASTDSHPCKAASHISRNKDYLYVTCSLSHEIHIVNASTLKTLRTIDLVGAHNPMNTLIVNDDLAYASGFVSNKLIAFSPHLDIQIGETRIKGSIDLNTLPLERFTDTAPRPSGLARIGDTGFVALANLDRNGIAGGPGYVLSFDLNTQAIKKLIKTRGRNTTGVYAGTSKENKNWLYIVNTGTYRNGQGYIGDGSVDIYDLEKDTIIQTIATPGTAPSHLQFASDGKAYLSNGLEPSIFSFNVLTFETYAPIDLKGKRCDTGGPNNFGFISSILVEPEFLYATEYNSNCLLVVDRNSGSVVRQFRTGDGPSAMMGF